MRLPFRVDNVSQLETIILHHIRGSQMVPDDSVINMAKNHKLSLIPVQEGVVPRWSNDLSKLVFVDSVQTCQWVECALAGMIRLKTSLC